MEKKQFARGVALTLAGGILWGFSGTCGQFLIQSKGLTSSWIVPVRLLSAGLLLLLICCVLEGRQVFRVWRQDGAGILIFGVFGMSMCQYTYFTAIGFSNAGTATVLQYMGPVLIQLWAALVRRRFPRPLEIASIVLALTGTFLLATHGNPRAMVLSPQALFWGLLSAVALAVYTVQPGRLLAAYGAPVVTAWGMVVGGILLTAVFRPWTIPVSVDGQVALGMGVVVVLGTIVAFCCYLEGVRCVGPKKGSLFASVEPLSAAVCSVLWMHVSFRGLDLLGFACILSTIFVLALDKREG